MRAAKSFWLLLYGRLRALLSARIVRRSIPFCCVNAAFHGRTFAVAQAGASHMEHVVTFKRRSLAIPPFDPRRKEPWTAAELKLVGTMPDEEVARRTGRSVGAVGRRRGQSQPQEPGSKIEPWTSEEDKLLGTVTDREAARLLDRSVAAVSHRRARLGIPARHPKATRRWTRDEEKLLGTQPDPEIARRLNRTTKSVLHRRTRLKIPPWRPAWNLKLPTK